MNDDTKKSLIASRLAIAREQAGLTQAQVARLLGMHRPTVSEIEAGRRSVAAQELVQFADAYHVDLDWLAGRDEMEVNKLRDELTLAARKAGNLKPDDLEKVISLLTSLRRKGSAHGKPRD